MGIELRRDRQGDLRPVFYGRYTITENGQIKRKAATLNKWQGVAPESGKIKDATDKKFIESLGIAKSLLHDIIENSAIESKHQLLSTLAGKHRTRGGRQKWLSEKHLDNETSIFKRFEESILKQNPAIKYINEITKNHILVYIAEISSSISARSSAKNIKMLKNVFNNFLNSDEVNPFKDKEISDITPKPQEIINRASFTAEELQRLYDVAEAKDSLMYSLIVLSATTSLRQGDCCRLKWSDVFLPERKLVVRTRKGKTTVTLAIRDRLYDVLIKCHGNDKKYVFPEANEIINRNQTILSLRFKKLVVEMLNNGVQEAIEPPTLCSIEDIREEAIQAILASQQTEEKKQIRLEIFNSYYSTRSHSKTAIETGYSKPTINYHLHCIQDLIDKVFIKSNQHNKSIKKQIATLTREKSTDGQTRTKYDFHSLRGTYITLNLAAGVKPMHIQQKTGHRQLQTLFSHYANPTEEQANIEIDALLPDALK